MLWRRAEPSWRGSSRARWAELSPPGRRGLWDGWLDRLLLGLLLGVSWFPGLISLAQLLWPGLGGGAASEGSGWFAGLARVLATTDAGAQSPLGAGLLRALVFLGGILWLARPRSGLRALTAGLWLWTVSLGVAGLGALLSPHPGDALVTWGSHLAIFLVFLMASERAASVGEGPSLSAGPPLLLAAVAMVLPATYWIFLLQSDPSVAMYGPFYQSNMLAGYLLLFLPLCLALFLELDPSRSPSASIATGALLVLVVAALYLSYSRGGWLTGLGAVALLLACLPALPARALLARVGLAGLGLSALLAGLWLGLRGGGGASWALRVLGGGALLSLWVSLPRLRSPWRSALVVLTLGLAVIYGMTPGEELVTPRAVTRASHMVSGEDTSIAARLELWKAALQMARERPWFGVGLDGFHRFYPARQGDLKWFARYTHSTLFELLSEAGVVGTLLVAFAASAFGWRLVRNLSEPSGEVGPWGVPSRSVRLGLGVGLLAFLVHSLVDFHLHFLSLPLTSSVLAALALVAPGSAPADPLPQPPGGSGLRARALGCLALGALSYANLRVLEGEVLGSLARQAAERGDLAVARSSYRAAALAWPWAGEWARQEGLLWLDHLNLTPGDPAALERLLIVSERGVALDAHRAVSWSLRGRALELGGDGQGARAAYLRALELDPVNYPAFYLDLARCTARLGQLEAARAQLKEAISRFPEQALEQMFDFRRRVIAEQLGDVHLHLGLMTPFGHPERMAALEAAASRLPRSQAARYSLAAEVHGRGVRRLSEGREKGAYADFRRAQEMFAALYQEDPSFEPLGRFLEDLARRGVGGEPRPGR